MTHTTTDAAEARALTVVDAKAEYPAFTSWWTRTVPGVAVPSSASHYFDAWMASARHRLATAEAASGATYPDNTYTPYGRRSVHNLAKQLNLTEQNPTVVSVINKASDEITFLRALTAAPKARSDTEAASGAGEREPMVAMGAALAAAISLLERGGKKAAPSDKMFEQMLRDYRRALDNGRTALASLPPATDPAMVSLPRKKLEHWQRVICGDWCKPGNHCSDCRDFAAALAAAPTIPATGEAILEGMKPWHGGDGPPDDWNGGPVLWHVPYGRDSLAPVLDGDDWQCHSDHTGKCSVVAYTPKATIPATGHAATEGEGA